MDDWDVAGLTQTTAMYHLHNKDNKYIISPPSHKLILNYDKNKKFKDQDSCSGDQRKHCMYIYWL